MGDSGLMSAKLEAGDAIVVPEKLIFSRTMKDVKDITADHDAARGHARGVPGDSLISRDHGSRPRGRDKGGFVEERQQPEYTDDVIDLGQYSAALRPEGLVEDRSAFPGGRRCHAPRDASECRTSTRRPRSSLPAIDEKKQIPALGALASFGMTIGGPSSVEDLESLFKSNDLTVRVFRKYNLWPIVLADKFDPTTGKVKPAWTDRLFGNENGPKAPRRLGRHTRSEGSPEGFRQQEGRNGFRFLLNLPLRKVPRTS